MIVDYINRFWINDVDARIQLFDLKTKYQFQTVPGYDQYNMPLYTLSRSFPSQSSQSYYPVYQGFLDPVYVNGIQVPFQTDKTTFFNIWPNIVQQMNVVTTGNGGSTYSFTFPIAPNNSNPITTPFQYILRGHVDMQGVIALANSNFGGLSDPPIVTNAQAANTVSALGSISSIPLANVFPAVYITSNAADGSNIMVSDSGQFLNSGTQTNQNYGLLMEQGSYSPGNPTDITGNLPLPATLGNPAYSTTSNTINYFTGQVNVTFPVPIPNGVNINAQCFLFQCGLPRGVLFWNNTIIFRSPPDQQYLVELDAYLSPAGFLAGSPQAIQFGYMCEYIARGAARKILSDTGDLDQMQFYEPLFREQEMLVWKRSQRQFTASRTQTIYSQGINQGQSGFNNLGGSTL